MQTPSTYNGLRLVVITVMFSVMTTSFHIFTHDYAFAESEPNRRLSAEIIVIKADLEKIIDSDLSLKHKKGKKERIKGGLAFLPLLIREAWDGLSPKPSYELEIIKKIQSALDTSDYDLMNKELNQLLEKYPFNTYGLIPSDGRPLALKRSEKLHTTFCARCHDKPDTSVSRPAWNLFQLSKRITPRELAARIIIGVRGDNLTGLENPLRNSEISALIAYYIKNSHNF